MRTAAPLLSLILVVFYVEPRYGITVADRAYQRHIRPLLYILLMKIRLRCWYAMSLHTRFTRHCRHYPMLGYDNNTEGLTWQSQRYGAATAIRCRITSSALMVVYILVSICLANRQYGQHRLLALLHYIVTTYHIAAWRHFRRLLASEIVVCHIEAHAARYIGENRLLDIMSAVRWHYGCYGAIIMKKGLRERTARRRLLTIISCHEDIVIIAARHNTV